MPTDGEGEESGPGAVSTVVNGKCMEVKRSVWNLVSDLVIPKYLAKVISHFLDGIGVIFH